MLRRAMEEMNMTWSTLGELKDHLQSSGIDQRAILSDADMINAQVLFDQSDNLVETPPDELRYIEGMFGLPLGFITHFRTIPAPGYERCTCGRIPTALDIVHHAHAKQIHHRELMRDALIGLKNIFEIATSGRTADCFACGRKVVVLAYKINRPYIYG